MPLVEIIRRASNYILGGGDTAPDTENFTSKMSNQYEDNEVLYCKNNVCVHPPAIARQDTDILHNPGYLTISTKVFVDQYNESRRPTLFLTWIPNATLTKCPTSSAVLQNLKISNNSGSRPPKNQEQRQTSTEEPGLNCSQKNEEKDFSNHSSSLVQSMEERTRPLLHIDLKKSTNPFLNYGDLSSAETLSKDDSLGNSSEDSNSISSSDNKQAAQPPATTTTIININVDIANPDIEIVSTPEDGVVCVGQQTTKDPDGCDSTTTTSTEKCDFSRSESVTSNSDDQLSQSYNNGGWMSTTPEFLAQKHNLTFPQENGNGSNSPSPILLTKKQHNNDHHHHNHKCRRFSVDLSQMRSLRLFFNDNTCTCGQLVVASRESQYKILHFHHGGLDRLAQVLHQWHSLLHNIKHSKGYEDNLPYRHFMVCRPEVSDLELHPEEGQVPKLTEQMFGALFNDSGQLEDDLALRKSIFFSGMERGLRKEVWPFLLHVYPYQSTYAERSQMVEIRRQEYEEVTRRRLDMTGSQLAHFRRKIQGVVEKDVVRTDRGNPYFTGDDNPNLDTMKNILLNYAVYNPGLGYTQGMSDLLAPVLCELKDEVAAFWCFVGLMQRAVFVATPTDRDMDRSLRYLRELVRLMVPHFHLHLEKHKDATELLFCHRWILLCFKREFTEGVALRMWEACWANYLTDYFHLFLCLAIICVYADDVIAQDLRADEMLLHFSSLAMYMDGQLIARKARGLLHQFRQLREIPCTLSDLCAKCGPGIWDSSHSPRIYCVAGGFGGHHHDNNSTTTTSNGYYCNNYCIPSN